MLPERLKGARFFPANVRRSSALSPLMPRSMSNSASIRLTASSAIGEIAAAFFPRRALAPISANSKN
jgi:hypothetical protein